MNRLAILDLPDGLLDIQTPETTLRVSEYMSQLSKEAMGERADPLGYVRMVYEHIGEPHGAGDAGAVAWLEEMFGAMLASPKEPGPAGI